MTNVTISLRIQSVLQKIIQLITIVLILSGLVIPSSTQGAVTASSRLQTRNSPTSDLSHRYILFLAGVNSSSASNDEPLEGRFEKIKDTLAASGIPESNFVYFSYGALEHEIFYCLGWGDDNCSEDPQAPTDLVDLSTTPVYSSDKTHLSIPEQAQVLDWLIDQIIKQDEQAEIDLIGFSLGGIVASYWAAEIAKAPNDNNIRGLVLLESPVGGIPLAKSFIRGCDGFAPACRIWGSALRGLFGETVLKELQVVDDEQTIDESIIDSLTKAPNRFAVTSIQSKNDYLVTGTGFPICSNALCNEQDALEVIVGFGAQYWDQTRFTLYSNVDLGGQLVTNPVLITIASAIFVASGPLLKNHHAPLENSQAIAQVVEAIIGSEEFAYVKDGDIWLANLTTNTQTQLTSSGANQRPTWSPDGRYLTYEHFQHEFDNITDIYIVDFKTGTERLLRDYACCVGWSPSGDEVAYIRNGEIDQTGGALETIRVNGSGRQVLEDEIFYWSKVREQVVWAEEQEIYLLATETSPGCELCSYHIATNLWRFDIRSENLEKLLRLPDVEGIEVYGSCFSDLALSPDRQLWAVTRNSFCSDGEQQSVSILVGKSNTEWQDLGPGASLTWLPDGNTMILVNGEAITVVDLTTEEAKSFAYEGMQPAWRPQVFARPSNESADSTTSPEPESPSVHENEGSIVLDADFEADITIPDNTVLRPGESFVKIWRIKNSGDTTWDPNFEFAFVDGARMDAPESVTIPQRVAPGEHVDVSVSMSAPSSEGTYQGYWQMRDISGTGFGSRIWVKIKVSKSGNPSTTPAEEPTETESIRFSRGSSSTTFEVDLSGSMGYSIGALADQWLYITTSRAIFITVLEPTGTELVPLVSSPTHWEFRLSRSGTHTIVLEGSGDTTVTIEIPPLE